MICYYGLFGKIISNYDEIGFTIMHDNLSLVRLSPFDGEAHYDLLQHIGRQENDFTNPVHDMTFEEFKLWLKQQDDWSRGDNLPQGYVPQVCYWLFADNKPVGFGKIRTCLTERSRLEGGSIGYAIDPRERGKGYGSKLLSFLLIKARELEVHRPLLTIKRNNIASKRVAELNGAQLIKETEDWLYYEVSI